MIHVSSPGSPRLGEPRRLVRRAGEALVAAAARTAPRHQRPLPGRDEVVDGAVGLDQRLGPGRHADLERLAVLAVAQRPLPVAAPARLEVRPAPEALQIAQRVVAHEHDVAAATAVATVRPALGHVRLAAEAEAAVAAAAGVDVDSRAILHGIILACPIPYS